MIFKCEHCGEKIKWELGTEFQTGISHKYFSDRGEPLNASYCSQKHFLAEEKKRANISKLEKGKGDK